MNQPTRVLLISVLFAAAIGFVLYMAGNPARSGFQAQAEKPVSTSKPEVLLSTEAPKALPVSPDLQNTNPYLLLDLVPEGKAAPGFSAVTTTGEILNLSDLKGKKNAVLVFYQGSFCSICGAQLSNLQKHMEDFEKQNAEIIAISADDMAHAMKTTGERGLSFHVVPDPDRELIRKFGVANISKSNIAWPSVYVIDKAGIVRLAYAIQDGHRLHSSDILPVLGNITGKPYPQLGYNE